MKKLLIMRHAKTRQAELGEMDFNRDLLEKGIKQSISQARRILDLDFTPELILVSPSKRTTQTIQLICKENNWDKKLIKYNQSLYMASIESLINMVAELDNDINQVMIVGHNLGIGQLVQYLSNSRLSHFKTGTFALFSSNTENWEELMPFNTVTKNIEKPII
jgi:phosphohistidine phosphatase